MSEAPTGADALAAQEDRSARSEATTWFVRGVGLVAGGLFTIVIALGFVGASGVALLFFFALLLASALAPLVDRLRGKLPIGRGAAVLFVYVSLFGVVAVVGVLVLPGAVKQVADLTAALPAAIQRAREATQQLPAPLAANLGSILDGASAALAPANGTPAASDVVADGLVIVNVVVSLTTVLALVYFWMTERARLQRFVLSFVPPARRGGTREAWNAVEVRLGNWVRGQLTLMAAVAIMTGIAYSVLGLPSALLLALLAGLAEVIPVVGPALGAVPALLVALAIKPELLPLVVIAYVVIQIVEGNVLVPLVMRNAVGVSPLLIILSLLAGAALGGFIGALVAVPIVASVEAVLERLQDREVPIAQDATAAKTTTDDDISGATESVSAVP